MPENEYRPTSIIAFYLSEMLRAEASDLYLSVGYKPSIRVDNKITPIKDSRELQQENLDNMIKELLTEQQLDEFNSTLELNVAISSYFGKRFRANLFRQQEKTGVVIRRIRTRIPDIDALGLPSVYKKLIMERRGLILVVGAAGAGKSTSMAAMLGYRNKNGAGHIITIEDPIEFIHSPINCIFTQREVGIDTYSFNTALKNALRQTPDVIVVGEIRDREVLEQALQFSEAGHLCIATLHANNSYHAIDRMVKFFSDDMHRQIQLTLSQNLKAIISQRLVENIKGTRTMATEVLLNQGIMKNLIEEGKIRDIKDNLDKVVGHEMWSFDTCLADLYVHGIISGDVALQESDNPSNMRLRLRQEQTKHPELKKAHLDEENIDFTMVM